MLHVEKQQWLQQMATKSNAKCNCKQLWEVNMLNLYSNNNNNKRETRANSAPDKSEWKKNKGVLEIT